MDERFVRTALIFGEDGMRRLSDARVAVFGVGGVGGHLVQALARAGVGHITVIDDDVVMSVSRRHQPSGRRDADLPTVGRPRDRGDRRAGAWTSTPACEV
ncbi:MAG: ThiF family adenylyltransferase [Christensenellales bacterium]